MEVDGCRYFEIVVFAVGGSGSFHYFHQLKLPRPCSVEASTTFHLPVCTSAYFHEFRRIRVASPRVRRLHLFRITCMECKEPSRHDVCLHHTYHADMIPGVSISYQTALSTSTRRLPAHPVSTLTNHPREIQALWSHNYDTGSYDTLYQVDSSSNDVRSDILDYDRHTHYTR